MKEKYFTIPIWMLGFEFENKKSTFIHFPLINSMCVCVCVYVALKHFEIIYNMYEIIIRKHVKQVLSTFSAFLYQILRFSSFFFSG